MAQTVSCGALLHLPVEDGEFLYFRLGKVAAGCGACAMAQQQAATNDDGAEKHGHNDVAAVAVMWHKLGKKGWRFN